MSAPAVAMRRDVPRAVPTTLRRDVPRADATRAVLARTAAPEPVLEATPRGTKFRPSMRTAEGPRGGGADWANARAYFRTPDVGDWVTEMHKRPEIFTGILSDIFRETQAEKRRLDGRAKIGRRPRVIDGSLNDLWAMITPKYASVPFGSAVLGLVGDLTPEEVAETTTIAASTYTRMLAGQDITMWRLEVLARAFNVSPAYFLEWRRSYVLTVVEELLTAQPNLSVRYARALAKVVGPLQHKKAG